MDQKLPQSQPMGDVIDEIESLSGKVSSSGIPNELKSKSEMMINRLRRMAKYGSYSSDFEIISRYIDWITKVPWTKKTKDQIDLVKAKGVMDKNHHGMDSVKNLVLDYLSVMKMNLGGCSTAEKELDPNSDIKLASSMEGSSSHAPIICFVGLQGVGKTTMAKSIAQTLGRTFIRISLGALGNVILG